MTRDDAQNPDATSHGRGAAPDPAGSAEVVAGGLVRDYLAAMDAAVNHDNGADWAADHSWADEHARLRTGVREARAALDAALADPGASRACNARAVQRAAARLLAPVDRHAADADFGHRDASARLCDLRAVAPALRALARDGGEGAALPGVLDVSVLRKCEWAAPGIHGSRCPVCSRYEPPNTTVPYHLVGHASDCRLAAILARLAARGTAPEGSGLVVATMPREDAELAIRELGRRSGMDGQTAPAAGSGLLWLVPLMDAFEAAVDAYAQRQRYGDASDDLNEEAGRIGSINDARLALRDAVEKALASTAPETAVARDVHSDAIKAALAYADHFLMLSTAYSSARIEVWEDGTFSDVEHADARRDLRIEQGKHAELEREFCRWWAPRDGTDGPVRALASTAGGGAGDVATKSEG